MTAKYWTTTGEDIWEVKERRVFDFTNKDTKEVVTCDVLGVIDAKFVPVIMPNIKKTKTKKVKVKRKSAKKAAKTSRSKSKYKGVRPMGKRFSATYWDGEKGRYMGMFDSDLLAAAAIQEAKGNHKEARRLRNEHAEGDPPLSERPMEE